MSRDEKFIKLAIQISELSDHRMRMGAVITKGNRIMGVGNNKRKSHPKQINHHTFKIAQGLHAERSAIINAKRKDLSGCTIHIARLTKCGEPAMAKPCDQCMAYIKETGIKRIVYTNQEGKIEKENVN
jgi:deoxycytidylate deaminase